MKTGVYMYQRYCETAENFRSGKGRSSLQLLFKKSNLILLPLSFLLGRVSMMGGMMPLGLPVYVAATGFDANRIIISIAIILGMITNGAREQLYVTIAAMFLFNALSTIFKNKKRPDFANGVVAFVSIIIPEMIITYLQGFLLYDFLRALFHGFIVFSMVFIFRNTGSLLYRERKKQLLSNEETISIAIIAALALSGLSDIQILGFALKNVLCILVILLTSYKCGMGVGAAIGVTVGLIVSMSATVTPLVIGSFAFCGLLAGVFRSLGKVGSSLGFVLGNTVLTLYLNGSADVLIYLKEIILSVIIFILIPQKLINNLTGRVNGRQGTCTEKRNYSSWIKGMTVDKLNRFSNAFKELSKTFSEISETKMSTDKNDISALFDRVADKVCKDCSLCLHCWDRNFYNTYQVMFKMIERLDAKGRIDESDVPAYFIDRCERVSDFVKTVNNIYEIFKVDMVWKNKIAESRGIVSQQLEGLSKVISNLAAEIDTTAHFDENVENTILAELNKAGVKAEEAIVSENKWGKYEVALSHIGCKGVRKCADVIEKVVSDIMNRKMAKEGNDCCQNSKDGMCTLKLIEEESYGIITGVAKMPKHNGTVSGDSYTFMGTGDGKYIVALSDGMGSGQKAAVQSRATINLLEQFIESGFDKDTTIKLINSVLVSKSCDDSFATIDLSLVDLYDGEVEFVKVGAVPTFLKKPERVEVIRSVSIPAGILDNIQTELIHKNVENGDFIIMVTDGVIDSFNKDGDGDKILHKIIWEIESTNPQEIAEYILNKACMNHGGRPVDDMTTIVAKVWKRVNQACA